MIEISMIWSQTEFILVVSAFVSILFENSFRMFFQAPVLDQTDPGKNNYNCEH